MFQNLSWLFIVFLYNPPFPFPLPLPPNLTVFLISLPGGCSPALFHFLCWLRLFFFPRPPRSVQKLLRVGPDPPLPHLSESLKNRVTSHEEAAGCRVQGSPISKTKLQGKVNGNIQNLINMERITQAFILIVYTRRVYSDAKTKELTASLTIRSQLPHEFLAFRSPGTCATATVL